MQSRSTVLACLSALWLSAAPAWGEVPSEAAGSAPEPATAEADADLDALLEEDPLFEASLPHDTEARDPWEHCNRRTFALNRGLDRLLFDPVTRGYRLLVPKPGRRAIERVVLNLDSPVIFINQVLQLRPIDSTATLGRFLINSSFGVVGLWDPATTALGIERKEGDFGQTMARYGVPGGPYVVLPVFGPSTARDAVGTVFDQAADPLTYLLGPLQWWALLVGGGEGLVVREAAVDELQALEKGSVDFYSALRSAYLQSRDAEIEEVRGDAGTADLAGIAD